jgi:hypothetical protein
MRDDNPLTIAFEDVEAIAGTDLVLRCRVGDKVVSVPPLRILQGSTIHRPGDRGILVLPYDVAQDLGLIA